MMQSSFRLSELVKPLNAEMTGSDVEFIAVNTDTRSIGAGDLFVALKGERFDAHDFAEKAVDTGAVALVVERELDLDVPQLIVSDTRVALGKIAEYNRTFFNGALFAITGSSGKTTVKEMLAEIAAGAGNVLATKGNLNNEIGVPLTLLQIENNHDFAVIEMGASGAGEIAYSVGLAHPDIALVNNAMGAHLEGFGSLQGVVEAKGEIYDGLTQIGTAVVNLDDPNAQQWIERAKDKRTITFAVSSSASDITARHLYHQSSGCYGFSLVYQEQCTDVRLKVLGAHNVSNALAAASMALAAGLPLETVASGLERFTAVKGRMYSMLGLSSSCVIDDSYNANPGSVKAAISVLNELAGERVLVLGDMGELGDEKVELHRDVGQFAAEQNIDRLLTVGELSKAAVDGYQEIGGISAKHFTDRESLLSYLKPLLHETMTVLVKGSRSAGMDKVVSGLAEGV